MSGMRRNGERMTTSHVYSQAPRCHECGGRARLTQEAARALVAKSGGRLQMVRCLHDGWHVWSPDLEKSFPRG